MGSQKPARFLLIRMMVSRFLLVLGILALLTAACTADERAPDVAAASLLPKEFAGWQVSGAISKSSDPAVGDPVNATVLKEYGFTNFEAATYIRDGLRLTLKAARFSDASGAYGAFTYYKMPQMLVEQIPDQAASLNERVLFYRGNILVDAVFQRLSAMSAAELRELSNVLPLAAGVTQNLPGLPAYLPKPAYVKNSAKYVLGPVTLEKLGAPIPAGLVDFNAGAEVVLGGYTSSGGEAMLTLISYPTPQIAGEHLRRIDAARQPSSQLASAPMLGSGETFVDKRTGPIVVVATGPLSQSEAKSLLASVNYDANVTWNENTYFTKRDNIANLLVNIIYLCGIIIGLALIAGLAFGWLQVCVRRFLPERIFGKQEEVSFISLHLSEETTKSPPLNVNFHN